MELNYQKIGKSKGGTWHWVWMDGYNILGVKSFVIYLKLRRNNIMLSALSCLFSSLILDVG